VSAELRRLNDETNKQNISIKVHNRRFETEWAGGEKAKKNKDKKERAC